MLPQASAQITRGASKLPGVIYISVRGWKAREIWEIRGEVHSVLDMSGIYSLGKIVL